MAAIKAAPHKNEGPSPAERFVRSFSRTPQGRKAIVETQVAEARLEERRAHRARLDAALAERARLPERQQDVAAAERELEKAAAPLLAKLQGATRAFQHAAESSGLQHGRATAWLRNTADPLVHDNGPVVQAIQNDRLHLLTHTLGTSDEMVRRVAKFKPPSTAIEDTGPVERAKLEVLLADASLERIDALDQALDDLRELALEVEVDPAAVREIVAACPTACECGQALSIGTALAATIIDGVPA